MLYDSLDLDTLRGQLQSALKAWDQTGGTPEEFLAHLLLVQASRRQAAAGGVGTTLRTATNEVILGAIRELRRQNSEAAEILTRRFVDGDSGDRVAWKLNLSRDQVNRRQREAIGSLSQIIHRQEMGLRQARSAELLQELPSPTYTRLFGVEAVRDQLVAQLLHPDAAFLLAIVGMGGVGKTALADAVVRQVIQSFVFERIFWLPVGRQAVGWGHALPEMTPDNLLTALAERLGLAHVPPLQRQAEVRRALKAQPCLVVIDNLEADVDVSYLLAHVADLTRPTKFLLTARTHPPAELGVLTFPLGELDMENTSALLRHIAERSGTAALLEATPSDLERIYAVTGGNPLAIRLIAGLINRRLPLPHILANLDYSPPGQGETLFQRIYLQTWPTLTPHAARLLPTMVLVAENGARLEQMSAMSGLPEPAIWAAVVELIARSLLEARGTIHQPRYAIHRLTETFLRTRILAATPAAEGGAFEQQVAANLRFWQTWAARAQGGEELEAERSNLSRAIQAGLEYPATWPAAVNLARQLFPFMERQGYWQEWRLFLEWMLAGWPAGREPEWQCVCLNQLGQLYQLTRQLSRAIETHLASARLAAQVGAVTALAAAHFQLSTDYYHTRQFEQSADFGRQALSGFQAASDTADWRGEIAAIYNQLGLTARARGDLAEAAEYLTTAVAGWRALRDGNQLARSLQNLAIVAEDRGDVAGARQHYAEAIALLRAAGNELDMARLSLSLGALHYNQGDWPAAQAAFTQAAAYFGEQPGYVYYRALAANNLGCALRAQARLPEAEEALRQAMRLWREADDEVSLANTLGELGRTLAASGRADEARQCYEAALELLARYPADSRAQRYHQEILALLDALCNP